MRKSSFKMKRMNLIAAISASLLAPILTSCDIKPIGELTADDGISRLRGLHKDENWERLIQEVNEYRSRFPYSQFAAEAELLQADAFFKTNRYPESIANYDDFIRRNPSHPKADFALYRVAKSYDLQSPEEADREQATSQKAIEKYNELSQRYPKSSYLQEASQRVFKLRERLAEHHIFIGNFYWKKEIWHAALTRYLFIAENFSDLKDIQSLALTKASSAYLKLAEVLEKDPKSDSLSFFRSTTPDELKSKAQQLLNKSKTLPADSSISPVKTKG